MNKTIYPNIVRGGIAIPLDRRNYFLVKGRNHEQGGIDIGSNPKTGLEVEDGEIVKMEKDGIKVYSAVPMLAGKSPAERVLMGEDPNKVFAAQETFKKINGLKDDGTKAQLGKQKTIVNMDNNPLVKMFRGTNNKPNNLVKTKQSNSKFAGLKTHDGRGYNSDYIDYIYDSLSKSNLNKMQQAVILSHIINESGGDPFALNKNSGKDYGLLQWVDRYTKTKETDLYKEIDNQLNYIYSTVNNLDDKVSWTHGGEGSGYQSLNDAYSDFSSDDLTAVNKGFSLGYVRPAGKHDSANNRFGLAEQIYDRIKRLGGDKPYTTKLNPKEEFEFRQWYKKLADKKGLNPSFDAEEHYYDYRGFWKNEDQYGILNDNSDAHFTDRYKKPGHPTFSNESIYSKGNTIGGNWVQDKNGNWLFNHSEYTKQYKNKTKDYLKGTGEGYIIDGDTIIDKKRLGGNMKHTLVEVNIGGNSKLIRVPSRSSTGESERSEGRDKAELGANYGKLDPVLKTYMPMVTAPFYKNTISPFSNIPRITPPNTKINLFNDNGGAKSDIWGDIIGAGSNIIGSLITRGINNKMIDNLKAPTMPVLETARKLNTKYNINPQEEAIKENLAAYERQVAGNTGSSRIALARINKGRNLATSQLVNLYGQKENIETQLRNQDTMNQQTVAARNIERINRHLTDVTNFNNKVTEMRADNNVSTVQNINQGVQDLLARRDRRTSFNKTLMAQTFANPNLPAELFYAAGIWDKNTYDMYRKQYAKS